METYKQRINKLGLITLEKGRQLSESESKRYFEDAAHSIVVWSEPSTNFPPMNSPVVKDVLPL